MGASNQALVKIDIKVKNHHFSSLHPEKLTVTLSNATQRNVKIWGFDGTPDAGPDLSPYLEFHIAHLVNGRREPVEIQDHRMLSPIDDLYGQAYELKPGQSWSQTFEHWLPAHKGSLLRQGRYEVKAEFDDAAAVGYLPIAKNQSVGKIVSGAIAFELK